LPSFSFFVVSRFRRLSGPELLLVVHLGVLLPELLSGLLGSDVALGLGEEFEAATAAEGTRGGREARGSAHSVSDGFHGPHLDRSRRREKDGRKTEKVATHPTKNFLTLALLNKGG
jgi:hypothetical protein